MKIFPVEIIEICFLKLILYVMLLVYTKGDFMEKTFGEFLTEKRKEKKLTQKELSKMLYVSESTISKWEKNVAHPDISMLPKLSEILGVSVDELVNSSVDEKSREEKVQAKKWRAFSMSWSLFFYISYGVALIPCFICNLAVDKTLSWFWIVFSALLLAFTFTNLPKLIKKHKLLILPISIYSALCLLLGVCCLYVGGDWFMLPVLGVLLGLVIIFCPIYIAKLEVFKKIRKYNEFVSIAALFVILNILLLFAENYSVSHGYIGHSWYLKLGLPISLYFYLALNLICAVRFVKVNKLLKTSIVLGLIDLICYIPPMFLKVGNKNIQKVLIDESNILKADFSVWTEATIDNNIQLIIFLTILGVALAFLLAGLIIHIKRKNAVIKK